MSDVFLAVALGLLVVLSAWGTTLAGLKGLGFSAFFGGMLTLLLLGVFSSGFSDDPNSSAIAGYAAPFLLLFVWAPVVGAGGRARPGSWWYRKRYDDGEKFASQIKYNPPAL